MTCAASCADEPADHFHTPQVRRPIWLAPPSSQFRVMDAMSGGLVEGHADHLVLAPNDVTGNGCAVRLKD
jgi:hypothetical protein